MMTTIYKTARYFGLTLLLAVFLGNEGRCGCMTHCITAYNTAETTCGPAHDSHHKAHSECAQNAKAIKDICLQGCFFNS